MSVGKICDNDMDVLFNHQLTKVLARSGATPCTFERQHCGSYIAKFLLRRPSAPTHFGRQGRGDIGFACTYKPDWPTKSS